MLSNPTVEGARGDLRREKSTFGMFEERGVGKFKVDIPVLFLKIGWSKVFQFLTVCDT